MIAGYQRLNEKKSQPNPNIVFIKPLEGPDKKIAQDFLERIAAQCRPIMREHYLYVTSLEEYEPNREFVGRNFNAGEVVQLVLKSPSTGRWLPFNYVQMVMMHELAHCKQMNHSRAFWAVRNSYASQMHELWSKYYTGDGLWGRGANLTTDEWEKNSVLADEALPEHLCGGTYRSRRKRKVKPQLSYQERKERRILKKFGKNGVALGADEEEKVKLESGKKIQAKPRVAGSMRGRELRAAAALARFEKQKVEPESIKDDDETESGSDSEFEDKPDEDSKDAIDVDGTKLLDRQGRAMVRVCEDEDADDSGAIDESQELQRMIRNIKRESPGPQVLEESKEHKPQAIDKRPRPSAAPVITIKAAPTKEPGHLKKPTAPSPVDPKTSLKASTQLSNSTSSQTRPSATCSISLRLTEGMVQSIDRVVRAGLRTHSQQALHGRMYTADWAERKCNERT
ncbi:DNA damage response protein wss1 [Fusarium austroafricanum]|uniref:DNA damage response protein wss1 n=1 Tax=Fusarium austroafricanum TaxID=2364996 RepID=A0A8H4KRS2_9HYPO|nr:DNA damage response protein wss1 [Fusarium austroafricanum]